MATEGSVFDEGPMELTTWPTVVYPLAPPPSDPFTGPYVCAHIPVPWLPYVLGALGGLLQPGYWQYTDEANLLQTIGWADTLVSNISQSDTCPEYGVVSVSIAMGAATGTAAVTFPVAFATTPTVLVSTADGSVIPSWESVTTTGFTARITSNVDLPAGLTADVSWTAGV